MSTSAPIFSQDQRLFTHLAPDQSGWAKRWLRAGILSFGFHAVLLGLLESVPAEWTKPLEPPIQLARLNDRPVVHLVAPRFVLTQPEPNTRKPATEVSLPQLLSRPEPARVTPPPSAPKFTPPVAQAARITTPTPTAPPVALPGAPKIETNPAPGLGVMPQGLPTPPPPPAEEKPKLALENLSPARTTAPDLNRNLPRIQVPRSGIEEAMRNPSRQPAGGQTIGDNTEPGGFENPLHVPKPGKNTSSVEVMSDARGVDLKPYLIQVLAAVRRNWFTILPESAKMGRQGRVQVIFAIKRNGAIEKISFAAQSGTDAFDRAAVSGISMSNPFPPLPSEYQNPELILKLSFLYNAH